MTNWLGMDALVDWSALGALLTRLMLDLAVSTLVIRSIYDRLYRNREYVFTYYLLNAITFLLCYLLRDVAMHLGVALALFGVFGILRYRTEQIRMRDLTYLFIVIGIGVLNAIADRGVSLVELLAVNGTVLVLTGVLELRGARTHERSTPMLYDRLELLHPGREAELSADISTRTGLKVSRVEVGQVDLLRDAAEVTVFHRAVQ